MDDGMLLGDPTHEAAYDQLQHQPMDCVEAAVADAVSQDTGHHYSDVSVADEAEKLHAIDPNTGQSEPIYDPATGTYLENAPALLEAYGVQAFYTDDAAAAAGGPATGMAALEQEVGSGQHVIVTVDGPRIWDQVDRRDMTDPGQIDHAVVVTGIDTQKDLVYLNDSGIAGGADEAVPISLFESAWGVGGHQMVVADSQVSHASTGIPMTGPAAGGHGSDTGALLAATMLGDGTVAGTVVASTVLAVQPELRAAAVARTTGLLNSSRRLVTRR